jgi:hypothetical protein
VIEQVVDQLSKNCLPSYFKSFIAKVRRQDLL